MKFSLSLIYAAVVVVATAPSLALTTLQNLAGIKIAGFAIRSKIYGEVFTNNQMFHLFSGGRSDFDPISSSSIEHGSHSSGQQLRTIFESETNHHNLYMAILLVSAISFIVDMNSEYRIEKLKNTKYFNKLEKTIEIFIIVFMTIMMRDVENAI